MRSAATWSVLVYCLVFRPWRPSCHVPAKYWLNFNWLHCVTSLKVGFHITAALRVSDPARLASLLRLINSVHGMWGGNNCNKNDNLNCYSVEYFFNKLNCKSWILKYKKSNKFSLDSSWPFYLTFISVLPNGDHLNLTVAKQRRCRCTVKFPLQHPLWSPSNQLQMERSVVGNREHCTKHSI
jgi:hypothetical protein